MVGGLELGGLEVPAQPDTFRPTQDDKILTNRFAGVDFVFND